MKSNKASMQEKDRLLQDPTADDYMSAAANKDTATHSIASPTQISRNYEVPTRNTEHDTVVQNELNVQATGERLSNGEGDVTEQSVTNLQSMMHILKGNIGTGILAMPVAVKNAGLWTGTIGLLFMGFVATHCMHLLVESSNLLSARTGMVALDYGDVAEQAFKTGPFPFRKFSKQAKNTVNLFLCITQLGFCIVYVLFIASNIKQVVEEHIKPTTLAIQIYETLLLIPLIPFTFIKNLNHLAPFSTLANLLTVLGLGAMFVYCVQHLQPASKYPAFNSWATLPLYFGASIYAFEGISLVLPVKNKMKKREDFGGLSGVLNTSMVIVTALYTAVGFYGYLAFGSNVKGSITLNMPPDSILYQIVRVAFAICIFISYGLQFYVPIQILWSVIETRLSTRTCKVAGNYILRTVTVIFTFAFAAIIPHLDLMIALIGSLSSSFLALVFPPLLHSLVRWPDNLGRGKWILYKDIVIATFGLLGFFAGSVTSLIAIVHAFQTDK